MRARFVSADVDDSELVKVFVNRNRCMGWGVCYSHAPEIYQPDYEGYSVVPGCSPRFWRSPLAPVAIRAAGHKPRGCAWGLQFKTAVPQGKKANVNESIDHLVDALDGFGFAPERRKSGGEDQMVKLSDEDLETLGNQMQSLIDQLRNSTIERLQVRARTALLRSMRRPHSLRERHSSDVRSQ